MSRHTQVRRATVTGLAAAALCMTAVTAAQPASAQAPTGTSALCAILPAVCTTTLPPAEDHFGPGPNGNGPGSVAVDPTLSAVLDSTEILNSIGLDLDVHLDGPSLDFGDFGLYAVDDLRLSASVQNSLGALVGDISVGEPATFLQDTLRLSAQASVDRLLGIKTLGSGAYLVDHLRLSTQGENLAVASLLNPDGSLAYASDTFRSSGPTISAALDGLASADLLDTVQANIVDTLRLSGQVGNELSTTLLPAGISEPTSLAYITDALRLSAQGSGTDIADLTTPLGGAYAVDTLRLSSQIQDDLLADILSDSLEDNLEASAEAVGTEVLGTTSDTATTPIIGTAGALAALKDFVLTLKLIGF